MNLAFGITVGVHGELVLVCTGPMCGAALMIRVLFDLGDGVIDDRGHVFVADKEQDRGLGVAPHKVAE
ncbi:Uncharacterised protein [Mycobacterium tuberculosis]|nr:Uncharacterised protein [Mycobacterium tuberculosis]